ncbi:MAG: alpha-isopropylmalate synthase regulatory domain-containing protein, partial [Rhodospirillaceae bacterium]
DAAIDETFKRFKTLADKKKEIFDDDLIALADDETGNSRDFIRFVSLEVWAGSKGPQRAALVLAIDGTEQSTVATGNGPVDATFNAIKALYPHEARLMLYQVHAVTEGTDAQAEVSVRLDDGERGTVGRGADSDTLVASCRAYVHALNKLLIKRLRTAPATLSA